MVASRRRAPASAPVTSITNVSSGGADAASRWFAGRRPLSVEAAASECTISRCNHVRHLRCTAGRVDSASGVDPLGLP